MTQIHSSHLLLSMPAEDWNDDKTALLGHPGPAVSVNLFGRFALYWLNYYFKVLHLKIRLYFAFSRVQFKKAFIC